jgi:orotate phosphoribosyltransferase
MKGARGIGVEKLKEELSLFLVKIGALKFGIFTLTSGKKSPYYIDLRLIPSYPEIFDKVVDIYTKLVKRDVGLRTFDRIAGIPTAGIPFSAGLALRMKKPFLYVRKDAKPHGMEKRIEGLLMPGDRTLLVDDLITTGTTMVNAVLALRAEGAVVKDALVLIDREEGGKEALMKIGVKLHSLMSISEIASLLHELGMLEKERLRTILKQIRRGVR